MCIFIYFFHEYVSEYLAIASDAERFPILHREDALSGSYILPRKDSRSPNGQEERTHWNSLSLSIISDNVNKNKISTHKGIKHLYKGAKKGSAKINISSRWYIIILPVSDWVRTRLRTAYFAGSAAPYSYRRKNIWDIWENRKLRKIFNYILHTRSRLLGAIL